MQGPPNHANKRTLLRRVCIGHAGITQRICALFTLSSCILCRAGWLLRERLLLLLLVPARILIERIVIPVVSTTPFRCALLFVIAIERQVIRQLQLLLGCLHATVMYMTYHALIVRAINTWLHI